MNEKNDNANCLSEEPLITADQVCECILKIKQFESVPRIDGQNTGDSQTLPPDHRQHSVERKGQKQKMGKHLSVTNKLEGTFINKNCHKKTCRCSHKSTLKPNYQKSRFYVNITIGQ